MRKAPLCSPLSPLPPHRSSSSSISPSQPLLSPTGQPLSGRAGEVDPELFDIFQMASSFEGEGEAARSFFQHSMPSNTPEDGLTLSPDRGMEQTSPFNSPVRPSQSPQQYRGPAESMPPYQRLPSSSPTSSSNLFSPPRPPNDFTSPVHSPQSEHGLHHQLSADARLSLHQPSSSHPSAISSSPHALYRNEPAFIKQERFSPTQFIASLPSMSDPTLARPLLSTQSSHQPLLHHPLSNTSSSASTPSTITHDTAYPQSTADLHRIMQSSIFAQPPHPSFPSFPLTSFHPLEQEDEEEEDDDHDDSPVSPSLPSPPTRRKRSHPTPSASSPTSTPASAHYKSPYYQSPGSTSYSRSLSAKRDHEQREEEKERLELQQIEEEEEKEKDERHAMEEGRTEGEGEGDDDTTPGGGKKELSNQRLARKAELARASRKRRKQYVQDLEQKCQRLAGKVEDLQRKLKKTQGAVGGLSKEERIRKEQQSAIKERLTHLIAQAHSSPVNTAPPLPPEPSATSPSPSTPSSSLPSPTVTSPSSSPPPSLSTTHPSPSLPADQERELHELVTRFVFNSRERQGHVLQHFERVSQCLSPGLQVRFAMWGLDQHDEFYTTPGLWQSLMVGEIGLDERQMEWILSKREAIHAERKNLATCELMLKETRGAIAMHLHSLHGHMDDLLSVMTPLQLAKFYLWVDANSWSLSMISIGAI